MSKSKITISAFTPPPNGLINARKDGKVYASKFIEDFQTIERYQEYKDCGFDEMLFAGEDKYIGEEYQTSKLKKMLDLCEKCGIKAVVFDERIVSMTVKTQNSIIGELFDSEQELDDYLRECVKDYKDHPAFYGVSLKDEPKYSMFPAMDACVKEDVRNIVITMWGNDGNYCSYFSMLPSLYAIRRHYDGVKDMEQIKSEFEQILGERFDDMMLLDLPGNYGKIKPTDNTYHKYMLFNDPFLGFLDTLASPGAKDNYTSLFQRLQALADKGGRFAYLYRNMACLCRVMESKYDLGLRTRDAYKQRDTAKLEALALEYSSTADAVEALADSLRNVWHTENRPHGFEVHDLRFGGLSYRLRSLSSRLSAFLRGELSDIPELDEEILPYWSQSRSEPYTGEGVMPAVHTWREMFTVNRM